MITFSYQNRIKERSWFGLKWQLCKGQGSFIIMATIIKRYNCAHALKRSTLAISWKRETNNHFPYWILISVRICGIVHAISSLTQTLSLYNITLFSALHLWYLLPLLLIFVTWTLTEKSRDQMTKFIWICHVATMEIHPAVVEILSLCVGRTEICLVAQPTNWQCHP